tara:strand:- start:8953 stop:9663 length:711 start_codon:yes stop_codon:yes gene_type:complete
MFFLKNVMCIILALNHINTSVGFNMAFNRRALLKSSLLASNSLSLSNESNSFSLSNESNNEINLARSKDGIYLTGPITEESCWGVTQALINYQSQLLHHDNIYNNINLYIQSPGGSLLPTLALVDEIKLLDIPVHTYIRGYAASAATLLSVVGSKRYMYNHSLMMIHGVKMYGQSSETLSDIKDMNSNVNLFIQIMKNIYLENSNITEEKLEEFFYRDKWISANEALSYGLIDEII